MDERASKFVWGTAALLIAAILIYQIGIDNLGEGVGPFYLVGLLALTVIVVAIRVLQRTGRGGILSADPASTVGEPGLAHFFYHDIRSAPLWLALRIWMAWQWLEAGYHKATGHGWLDNGGVALKGYWTKVTSVDPQTGAGPIVYGHYRDMLSYMLNHGWYSWFATVIVMGELAVGLGLLFGCLTGWAAFGGLLMNFSFMLAGSASTNPVLAIAAVAVILGYRVAGYYGLDRILLPALGVPGLGRPASGTWGGAVQDMPAHVRR